MIFVRSQKGDILSNITKFEYNYKACDNIMMHFIMGDNNIIGEYKSRDRCMEILDHIQELINLRIQLSYNVGEIYQMPKK